MLGDRAGKNSYIRYQNDKADEETHTEQQFLSLIQNFYLEISDGIIKIKDINLNKIFLKFENEMIIKDDLDEMEIKFEKQNDKSSLLIGDLKYI